MLRIIIVDDEAPIREWFSYCISNLSAEYEILGSFALAEEAYKKIIELEPDIVITDVRMPGIDGLELLKMVKEKLPQITFVILSNHADFTYAQKAMSFGAKHYILKSEVRNCDIDQMLKKIHYEKKKHDEWLQFDFDQYYNLDEMINNDDSTLDKYTKIGLRIHEPYAILTLNVKHYIFDIELSRKLDSQYDVCIFAFRNNNIHIILQKESYDKRRLVSYVTKTFNNIIDIFKCSIGLSVGNKLPEFKSILEKSYTALKYKFIAGKDRVYIYDDLLTNLPIDRASISNKYYDILADFDALKSFNTLSEVCEWFESQKNISIGDVEFTIGICKRMVLSLQDRFYQTYSPKADSLYGIKDTDTLENCLSICKSIIKNIIEDNKNTIQSQAIKDAVEYITINYNHKITLAQISAYTYLSSEYFCRLFKEETGMNFSEYLMNYRLRRARNLLKSTDLDVNNIANLVGYENQSYFSKLYKKKYSISPKHDRKP